jgi:phosphonatase-like hydrolase
MAIKMVVFDMAGTTVADKNSVSDAFISAFSSRGLTISRHMVDPLMGYKKPMAIKMVLDRINADASEKTITQIHEQFVDEMLNHYEFSAEVQPMPGAEETLWQLKEEGMIIALNTGFSRDIADVIVERMQWREMGLVDDYIASDEVAYGRPDPAMILKLMRRAGITDPKEVIKIGDTEVDVREGKNAGCLYSIAVTTGTFTREELKSYHPDFIIDHLSELQPLIHQHA